jgi:hypothetical protein
MLIVWITSTIVGVERIKKLGYCLIRKTEGKPCDECKKTNVFNQGEL